MTARKVTKVRVFVATFVEQEVSIPLVCPACKAKLTEEGSVREWNWMDGGYGGSLDRAGFNPGDDLRHGDEYMPFEYRCNNCDHILASADTHTTHLASP